MEETPEDNLQQEDLLIKLRGKLNEEKIKLWEPPYLQPDDATSSHLQELAKKYATALNLTVEMVLPALHKLQLHSLDRSKANATFQETGEATFRIKATIPGQKPVVMKIQRKLDTIGREIISHVAGQLKVAESRVKLISNGKVIKGTSSLEEQGVKNGAQLMALIMTENPDEVRQEDKMYLEMKATRDDATLLSECTDELGDEQYMQLEDQSGNTVELPAAERRSLMVGLALHERGRTAAKEKKYPLALLLFLEADRTLSECRSSILRFVDNWALLQLDISWCYLCLQSLSSAGDAAQRLLRAEESFKRSYGEDRQRLIALKGAAAVERVLIMRMFLLQGIVAYHQNKRDEARRLLEKAEGELNALRVDETSVAALMELGWSRANARTGLRATGGDVDRAHLYLHERSEDRDQARKAHRELRRQRLLGLCEDGSPVKQALVDGLISMGYSRKLAIVALRNSNNHVAEAVRLIQEQPEMLADSDISSDELATSSEDSIVEPDVQLVEQLVVMGYEVEEAKSALRLSANNLTEAVNMLVEGGGRVDHDDSPGTSSGSERHRTKRTKKGKAKSKAHEALGRLQSAIQTEDDDYLDTSLVEEENFLAQYKSLL